MTRRCASPAQGGRRETRQWLAGTDAARPARSFWPRSDCSRSRLRHGRGRHLCHAPAHRPDRRPQRAACVSRQPAVRGLPCRGPPRQGRRTTTRTAITPSRAATQPGSGAMRSAAERQHSQCRCSALGGTLLAANLAGELRRHRHLSPADTALLTSLHAGRPHPRPAPAGPQSVELLCAYWRLPGRGPEHDGRSGRGPGRHAAYIGHDHAERGRARRDRGLLRRRCC